MENNTDQIQTYWKSYEAFASQDASVNIGKELLEKEFMSSPLAEEEQEKDGFARRDFIKLMGASIALSSFGCVRRPVQRVVPYAKAPLEINPGVANYYASTLVMGGEGAGLLVKSQEGRPIKLEGNPSHPVNGTALSARAQAYVLSLYDPDRIQKPRKVERNSGADSDITWDAMDQVVLKSLAEGEVAILTSSSASPTTKQLIGDFLQGFKGRHVTWDAISYDDVIEGQKKSYGTAVMPRLKFNKAKMIVAIDCDFLGTFASPIEYARGFSKNRKPGEGMSVLVAFESNLTLTGAAADTRVRIRPSQHVDVVLGLLNVLISKGHTKFAGNAQVKDLVSGYSKAAQTLGTIEAELFEKIALDLWEKRGQSLVVAGGFSSRTENSTALQIAVNLLNSALENDGKTIDGTSVIAKAFEGSSSALQSLISDMRAGKIGTLIINGVNPVYSLSEDSGFVEAMKNVKTIIYTGDRVDETARHCDFVAPDVHAMENWSDAELQTGVLSIQQPTLRPLYDNSPFQFTLMNWATLAKKGPQRLWQDSWYKYFHQSWLERFRSLGAGGNFEDFWTKFLQEGVFVTKVGEAAERDSAARNFNFAALAEIKSSASKKSDGSPELVLYSTVALGDGSLANLAWLQELPDPISKITWDSYLAISPAYSTEKNIKSGDVVTLDAGGVKIETPVHVQPGLHDQVFAFQVGYGRTATGSVGNGIGSNGFKLAKFNKGNPIYSGISATITKTGKTHALACVQEHHHMEGRQIIAQATLAQYLKKKTAGLEHDHSKKGADGDNISVWKNRVSRTGYRWGMVIDQTACIGCSACVTACQSENNIPVVGKKYVLAGREMHWLRIDRYYSAPKDTKGVINGKYDLQNPDVLFQPLVCQHCENAPCETVCPVAATVHDDQGLNTMIYNRCVGTRYCANNCPYKVRRFNWFNYQIPEHPYSMAQKPLNKQLNPAVGVRTRGVMEKCSFCIQRIDECKNTAKDENRTVRDGEVVTACEQTCPTSAIVFGDLNDPNSRVSKASKDERAYRVLEEFNANPAVRYLTRIRNAHRTETEKEGHHS